MRKLTAKAERIGRLTGRGNADGGGLPLPDLFGPILNLLSDSSIQGLNALTEAVQAGFLGQKTSRIRTIYGGVGDPWPLLMRDAVDQLVEQGLIQPTDEDADEWELGPKFVPGKALRVIPASQGKPSITVTVQAQGAFDEGTQNMYLTERAAELDPRRGGLRKVDLKHVDRLKASMEANGFARNRPLTYDQHGRLLDGRHRRAAAEQLGIEALTEVVPVGSDREALAVAWQLNLGQESWTKAELDKLARELGGAPLAQTLSLKPLVEAALREHSERSDRKIAEQVRCSHPMVAYYRRGLEAAGVLATPEVRFTEKEQTLLGAFDEMRSEDPDISIREVARETTKKENDERVLRAALKKRQGQDPQVRRFGNSSTPAFQNVADDDQAQPEAGVAPEPEVTPTPVPEPEVSPTPELPPLFDEVEYWVSELTARVSSPEVLKQICSRVLEHVRGR